MVDKNLNIVAIVQARMGSARLPGKVMMKINNKPNIGLLLERLLHSKRVTKVVLATSLNENDNSLADYVNSLSIPVYRGNELNVLNRYYQAACKENADVVIRITGDCPLIDGALVDEVIDNFFQSKADYSSNREPPTYPDGLDVEVMTFKALKDANNNASTDFQKEHVTPYIINSDSFKKFYLKNSIDFSNERWTIDEHEDFLVIEKIFNNFYPKVNFSWQDIIDLRSTNPEIFMDNAHLIRNEGSAMKTGQKLWKRAKKVIPGGNMLLSKRSEMYLPEGWPSYFKKAKGCYVWDLDGRKYTDMHIMGIGTNILGYGNQEVDSAVMEVVKKGNMSTFNCSEEVHLSEELISIHPWADMVRLARTGGEANAIAIRIARAASGKDKIAMCGYHGWHDWYLAANLDNSNKLEEHLLPGLNPKGVPENLKDTIYPFSYNNIEELELIIKNHDIGVIKMEVSRNSRPKDNFLSKVRQIADKNNIVLVFDECTSGFRETDGGLHKLYKVEPDIAIFGKALGNGYAITAVIGRREIMDVAQSSFISSTFWTERIGPSAAIKVLEVMKRVESWKTITKIGIDIGERWKLLGTKYDLPLKVEGLPSMNGFSINSDNWLKYKTYITQQMLKEGILASNIIYVCTEHKEHHLKNYFDILEPIIETISKCENEDLKIDSLLDGPVAHSGFKRLN